MNYIKIKWELESKISLYEFFLKRNLPLGCKSSVEKKYNELLKKYQILYEQ
jgi:hypothetical protein